MSKTISHHRKYTQHTTWQSLPWTFTSEKRKAFIYTKSSHFLYKCSLSLGLNEELGPSLRTRARAQQIRALAPSIHISRTHRKTTCPVIPALWGVGKGSLAWQPNSGVSKRPCLTETGQKITRVLVLPLASARTHTHIHHTRAQQVKG